MKQLRVALVHDYIKEYGGAERVLETLHELYPDAPVFTTVYLPEFLGPHKERFQDWDIRTSWVQNLPFKSKLISPLRLIAPLLFRQFDFSEFDVIIVSATGAYNPNTIRCHPERSVYTEKRSEGSRDSSSGKAGTQNDKLNTPVHICYCHTPPRYLYGYATARDWKNNVFFRILGEIVNHFLRLVDFQSAQNVDFFIANSEEVKKRIQKFYRKDAIVINPPVEVSSKYTVSSIKQDKNTQYFLAGGRLARPKHIELIVEACAELHVPLKVFGRGFAGYEEELKKALRGKRQALSIEFVGEVSDEEKFELMRNAKAYLFASEDEDFGITPVEAMSVGTPVIAYRSGGVQETVIDGKTGLFFNELTIGSLKQAIHHLNDIYHLSMSEACVKHAQKFSKERFQKEIRDFVAKIV